MAFRCEGQGKMAQSTFQKLKNRWAAETKDEEKLAAHLVMLFRFSEYLTLR